MLFEFGCNLRRRHERNRKRRRGNNENAICAGFISHTKEKKNVVWVWMITDVVFALGRGVPGGPGLLLAVSVNVDVDVDECGAIDSVRGRP